MCEKCNAHAKALTRYTYLSSDPTRTDAEEAEMLTLRATLLGHGIDLGLPPVARDGEPDYPKSSSR